MMRHVVVQTKEAHSPDVHPLPYSNVQVVPGMYVEVAARCHAPSLRPAVMLSCSQIDDSLEALSVSAQLKDVWVLSVGTFGIMVLPGVPVANQLRLLRFGLLLAANYLNCTPKRLSVAGFTASPAMVQVLRGLPVWRTELRLMLESDPTVMQAPWPLANLPAVIPR